MVVILSANYFYGRQNELNPRVHFENVILNSSEQKNVLYTDI